MKTAVSGDDFGPRKIILLLGAAAIGWKLVNHRKVKSAELLALLGLWGFFKK